MGAWDNFYWYEKNEPTNLGAYLLDEFKNSPIYESETEAMEYASKLLEQICYVEYGIQVVDTEYTFYGD